MALSISVPQAHALVRTAGDDEQKKPAKGASPYMAGLRILKVNLVQSLAFLPLNELGRAARVCRDFHMCASEAVCSSFSSANYVGSLLGRWPDDPNHFRLFPDAFKGLRNEIVTTAQLIARYWKNRSDLRFEAFCYRESPTEKNRTEAVELSTALSCAPSLQKLTFCYGRDMSADDRSDSHRSSRGGGGQNDEVANLIQVSSNLQQCYFFYVTPSLSALQALVSCTTLECFQWVEPPYSRYLENCRRELPLYYKTLIALLTSSIKLHSFHLTTLEFTIPLLQALASQTHLTDLAIGYRRSPQDRTSQAPFPKQDYERLGQALIATIQRLPALESLSLTAFPGFSRKYITDLTIGAVATTCTKLRKLHLEDCTNVSSASIASLAKRCAHLETLVRVHGWYRKDTPQPIFLDQADDIALQVLATNTPELRDLTMTYRNISDTGLTALAKCNNLQTLSVRGCKNIRSSAVHLLLSAPLPQLRKIDLRDIPVDSSPQDLQRLFAKLLTLPSFTTLEIDSGTFTFKETLSNSYDICIKQEWQIYPSDDACKKYIEDTTLAVIASIAKTRELCLINCSKVTSRGIAKLATQSPQLEVLSLLEKWEIGDRTPRIYYNGVCDAALVALSKHCPRLRSFKIVSRSIGDAGIASLAACKQLEVLELRSCPKVTLKGLSALLRALPPNLTLIDLREQQSGYQEFSQVESSIQDLEKLLKALLPKLPAAFKLKLKTVTFEVLGRGAKSRLLSTPTGDRIDEEQFSDFALTWDDFNS